MTNTQKIIHLTRVSNKLMEASNRAANKDFKDLWLKKSQEFQDSYSVLDTNENMNNDTSMTNKQNSKFHSSPNENDHSGLTSKDDVCPECDGAGETLSHDMEDHEVYECETCGGTGIFKLY